jgi:hypothetical protein
MTVIAQGGQFWYALQYGKYEDGYTQGLPAKGAVTFIANPAVSDTLAIDGITYTFKASLTTANDVKIGVDLDTTLANLYAALNGTVLSGAYFAATVPQKKVICDVGTHTLFLTSLIPGTAGNSITLTQGGSGVAGRFTLSASTLLGGTKGGNAVAGVGSVAIAIQPIADDTLVIGVTTYTWKASASLSTEITIGANRQTSITNLLAKLASNAAIKNPLVNVEGGSVAFFKGATPGVASNSTVTTTTTSAGVALAGTTLLGGQDAFTYVRSNFTWKRHRARELDYDASQMQQVFPLELGSTIVPTGAYKSGVALSGGVTLLPRLEDDFGVLLLASLGKSSSSSSGGVGTHIFTFLTNESETPWLAIRKMIPGRDNVDPLGMVGFDNKVAALRLTMPPAAPIEARLEFIGRVPELDNHPDVWEGEAFEDFKSTPLACKGHFTIPTIFEKQLPTTQVVVELQNGVTTPREEMIIGSYFMDDIVMRTRALMLRFVFKWNNPELYQRTFAAKKGGKTWSPEPFITSTDLDGNFAFDILMESPFNIPGTTTPYSLRIRANSCYWEPQGNMQLQAGGIVMQQYMATVLAPAANAYCEFILVNGNTSGYSVPAEP